MVVAFTSAAMRQGSAASVLSTSQRTQQRLRNRPGGSSESERGKDANEDVGLGKRTTNVSHKSGNLEEIWSRGRLSKLQGEKPNFFCCRVKSKGVGTLLFIALFVTLLNLFGILFQLVEADHEIERNKKFVDLMQRIRNSTSEEDYDELVAFFGVDATFGMQNFVSFIPEKGTWESFTPQAYFSAYYYAFVISTTIGYGEIVTRTPTGKFVTCIAIFSMLPIAIVTYTRVAELMSNYLMKLFLKQSTEFRAVLRKFDNDKSGTLDEEELQLGFHDLGLFLTIEEVRELIRDHDTDGDGVLDVDEFATVATELDVQVGKMARRMLKLRFAIGMTILFVIFFAVLVAFILSVDAVDAVYFSVVTLSTVGLGDITPTPQARAFLTIPIFVALGLVALVIESITSGLTPEASATRTAAPLREMSMKSLEDETNQQPPPLVTGFQQEDDVSSEVDSEHEFFDSQRFSVGVV